MGMPIRENQVFNIQVLISRPHLGRRDRSRLDHGGPERVTTVPSGPYRWSLSRTMITAPSGPYRPLYHTVSTAPSGPYRPLYHTVSTTPSGPYRPLFHTVSTAPSGPYSFLYPLLRFRQT